MSNKNNTSTYRLKDGNQTVYIGTTNNLEKREAEHRRDGKKFTSIEKTSRLMSQEGAKNKEAEQLETYRRGHNGKNPKYNKDCDG